MAQLTESLMNISQTRYLEGPNLWASHSGLHLYLSPGADAASWLAWRPGPDETAQALDLIRALAPRAVANNSTLTQFIPNARYPTLALLTSFCDALLSTLSIAPQASRMTGGDLQQLRWFVPCDDAQLGRQAAELALACLSTLTSLGATAAASPAVKALKATKVSEADAPGAAQPESAQIESGQAASAQAMQQNFKDVLRGKVRAFEAHVQTHGLNANAVAIARAAAQRGIPFYRIKPSSSLVQLGQGHRRQWINGAVVAGTQSIASTISTDKFQTASLLFMQGLPTSEPRLVQSADQAAQAAKAIGYPVVIKPRATDKGAGITTGISDESEIAQAFARAAQHRCGVLIERHVAGDDHRLLVIGGRFAAAARREPAQVLGDGRHSIARLVEKANRERQQGISEGNFRPEVPLVLNAEALQQLQKAGLDAHSVPAAGQAVVLSGTANLSAGGISRDVSSQVHPDNRLLAERAAALLSLPVAGIDFQTTDISRSWRETGGAVLEVNAGPGLQVHLPATAQTDVASRMVEHLFEDQGQCRVPLAGITGSLGKTTTSRMLAHILTGAGDMVALTTTQGTYVGAQQVRQGDCAVGRLGAQLLLDPAVTAGVFELARGGLLKSGMGVDQLDVGAVLNVHDNHLGLDGINSREDMAQVKQLVVRHAKELAVLNADDPLCLAMRSGLQARRLGLVSESPDNPDVLAHLASGGLAAFLHTQAGEPWLVLQDGNQVLGRLRASEMPSSWQARFRPAMLNALFAMIMAHGLKVGFDTIVKGLTSFESSYQSNPGRMNFIPGLPYPLLLFTADGPEALAGLAGFARINPWQRSENSRRTLVFNAAGNRPDAFITASAKAVAGAFSHYVCTEEEESLRGRRPGEVAHMLAQSLRDNGVPASAVTVELSNLKAYRDAVANTPAGTLLAIESYQIEHVMDAVRQRQQLAPEIP
jgi:cyanophycin synthetase